MAVTFSNPSTQKLYSVSLPIFTCFFILLASATKVNSAEGISFDFSKFTQSDPDVTLQGSAQILSNGILALTKHANPSWSEGRALYSEPIPIWDSTTANVASFVTSFSFVVQDIPGRNPADGIVFFLAPQDTEIPNNSSGGKLGVVDGNTAFNPFVGVEFDSYVNDWDADYAHIGIDVNSLISLKTVKWNRVSGSLVKVTIMYDSLTKTLGVVMTNANGQISTIAQVVDLKAVLPEKVKVGFSATTTSGGQQVHDIHSWSFTSTMETTASGTSDKIGIASYA